MILEALATLAVILITLPTLLYLWNSLLFRGAAELRPLRPLTRPARRISVLIPARNEEANIAACVNSVLASRDVEFEVLVLDDHSDDRTAEIVGAIATSEERVRVETAPQLPPGWNGKQHACFTLSKLARFPILTFLDADVRLEPDALARLAEFLKESKAELVSGFPRQETGTFLEKLLIPLIHWVLLSYLPLWGMRHSRSPAFGAGCGQWFMTTRDAYQKTGGHEAIKASMHDGLTLPRAYRQAGMRTDLCDATELASCRMYHSTSGVWFGLAKNAHEGMGTVSSIIPWSVLLLGSLAFPCWLFVRMHGAMRYRQTLFGAILHPVGILLLIAIQWYALWRRIMGKPITWKGNRIDALPRTLANRRDVELVTSLRFENRLD